MYILMYFSSLTKLHMLFLNFLLTHDALFHMSFKVNYAVSRKFYHFIYVMRISKIITINFPT